MALYVAFSNATVATTECNYTYIHPNQKHIISAITYIVRNCHTRLYFKGCFRLVVQVLASYTVVINVTHHFGELQLVPSVHAKITLASYVCM